MQPVAAPEPAPVATVKKSGGALVPLLAGIVVLLLCAAGAGYWFFLRPAPVVPMGVLQLNATPFAEVMGVTSDKGKAIPLPDGDHWTPLRLDDIPIGKYNVDFKGADGSTQSQQCDVEQSTQVCSVELKPIDDNAIEQIIGGAK
jgi:serine/threonine-protein kinase